MWKCQRCGGLQRINPFCKYCGYKFPQQLSVEQLRKFRKEKEWKKLKPHGRFD